MWHTPNKLADSSSSVGHCRKYAVADHLTCRCLNVWARTSGPIACGRGATSNGAQWIGSTGHRGVQAREVDPPHYETDLSELKTFCDIDATVQISKSGSKNLTASLAAPWKDTVRLATWKRAPHLNLGLFPKAVDL